MVVALVVVFAGAILILLYHSYPESPVNNERSRGFL